MIGLVSSVKIHLKSAYTPILGFKAPKVGHTFRNTNTGIQANSILRTVSQSEPPYLSPACKVTLGGASCASSLISLTGQKPILLDHAVLQEPKFRLPTTVAVLLLKNLVFASTGFSSVGVKA